MRKGTAFRKLTERRELHRDKILNLVQSKGEITTYEIYDTLKIKRSSITGRLSELEQAGLIYQKGKFVKEKGAPCTIWKQTPPEAIEARKTENWNKRLIAWISKGKRNGFISEKELNQLKKQSTLFS